MKGGFFIMYTLAIDVGTTNIKLDVFEENELVDRLTFSVETYREANGKVYQNPKQILRQIKQGIKQYSKAAQPIERIVLSTTMHSLIPVFDHNMDSEMYIWLDSQAEPFINKLKETPDYIKYYKKTGTPVHEMSPFAKIGEFNSRDWFADVKQWIGMKEYLMSYFTGELVVDYSVASATGLFNIHKKEWDKEILEEINVTTKQLAKLVDTNYHATLKNSVAEELFITPGIPIYIGASDGCLASYASYVANGTVNTLTIGTSGAVRSLSSDIQLNEEVQNFCYYLNDEFWVIGGASNNGGQIVSWANETLYEGKSLYKDLNQILNKTTIGSKGLIFYPYLSGERAPLWQAQPNGAFVGLSLLHSKNEMIRSVIEGILYNLRYIGEQMNWVDKDMSVNGGFFHNELLVMMTADIFGKNIRYAKNQEVTYGALNLVSNKPSELELDGSRVFFNESNYSAYTVSYQKFSKRLKRTM